MIIAKSRRFYGEATFINIFTPRIFRIAAVEIPVNDLLQIGPPAAVMLGEMPSFRHPVSSPEARADRGG
jgi:hypothetical protein